MAARYEIEGLSWKNPYWEHLNKAVSIMHDDHPECTLEKDEWGS
jgi:hypothetical protein